MLIKADNQEVEFYIPEKYKKIAINCSGGADSSILLYMTIKFLIDNNRTDTKVCVLTCSNDLKGRWNSKNATKVIDFVIESTKTNFIDKHISYYRDLQKTEYFHEVEFDLFKNNKIDIILSGVTANPPVDSMVTNIQNEVINLSHEALQERNSKLQPVWYEQQNGTWYNPFINVDKKMIAAIYDFYNVTDTLLPLTRSCESIEEDKEKYNEPCGTCWWCLERKWAFGKF